MEKQGEIILYQPDEAVRLEVRLEDWRYGDYPRDGLLYISKQ